MKGKPMQMPKNDLNKVHAQKMFHTFLQEFDPVSTMLTIDGYERISEQFGEVDREDRAYVFIMFKGLLEDRGIPYDARQFGGHRD